MMGTTVELLVIEKDEELLLEAIDEIIKVLVVDVVTTGATAEDELELLASEEDKELLLGSLVLLKIEDNNELLLGDIDEEGLLLGPTDDALVLLKIVDGGELLLDNAEEDKLLLEEVILDVVTLVGAPVVVAVLLDDAKEDRMLLERPVTPIVDVATFIGVVVVAVVAVVEVVAVVGVVAVVSVVAVVAVARAELSEKVLLGPMLLDTDRLIVVILEADEDARLDKLETAAEEMAAGEETEGGTLGLFEDDKEELVLREELLGTDDETKELDAAAEARFAEEDASDDIDDDTLELLEDDT
ncbi:hypothetical protein KCU73_g9229, partial [Aureobasidium melanogenum]